jgi:hypothetical protein
VFALTLVFFVGSVVIMSILADNLNDASQKQSLTLWREVPIEDKKYVASGTFMDFDLHEIIADADYIFSGKVVDRREYEVEWIDDYGELWGPFSSSVIEVKINEGYYGQSPVEGDCIKIYYPYSLSAVFDGSFIIQDGSDYVFITNALDEEFVQRRNSEAPDDRFEQEKYADVYISNTCYSLLLVEGDTVIMHHDFFNRNSEVMQRTKSSDSVRSDKMASLELVKTGWFIALDISSFDLAFKGLLRDSMASAEQKATRAIDNSVLDAEDASINIEK